MGLFWSKKKKEECKFRHRSFTRFHFSEKKIPTEEELREEFRGLYKFLILERVRSRSLSNKATTKEAIEKAKEGIENFPSSEFSPKHISKAFELLYDYAVKIPHYFSASHVVGILDCIVAYRKVLFSLAEEKEHFNEARALIRALLFEMSKLTLQMSVTCHRKRFNKGNNTEIAKLNELLSAQAELLPNNGDAIDLCKVFDVLEQTLRISKELLAVSKEKLGEESIGDSRSIELLSSILLKASNVFLKRHLI